MFEDAIIGYLELIYGNLVNAAGSGSMFDVGLQDFSSTLYGWILAAVNNAMIPIATIILCTFGLIELIELGQRFESSHGEMPAKMIGGVLMRFLIAIMLLQATPILMNAIFALSQEITAGFRFIIGDAINAAEFNEEALRAVIAQQDWGGQLGTLMTVFLVYLISWLATIIGNVVITGRFIELYVHFAIAPIPVSTLIAKEHSSIGKNFLKSFAAVSLQGSLLFLVMTFFPILMNETVLGNGFVGGDVAAVNTTALVYSIILITAIVATGKWAKSIMNAS